MQYMKEDGKRVLINPLLFMQKSIDSFLFIIYNRIKKEIKRGINMEKTTKTTIENEIKKLNKEDIELFANEKGINSEKILENTEALFLLSQRKDIIQSIDKIQKDDKEPQVFKEEMLAIRNEEKSDIDNRLNDILKPSLDDLIKNAKENAKEIDLHSTQKELER